jgi:hypothetical protein
VITCITNHTADLRACTVLGDHYDECDGFEYTWVEKRGREEATGNECRGCLPRPASQGLVCLSCWRNITAALAGYPELVRMLTGVDRAVVRDSSGMTSRGGPGVPLSSVQLSLEELDSYFTIGGVTAEQWVSSELGARDAVRFARAFAAASSAHPTREKSHRIKRVRCPECNQLTLVWHPTQREGGDVQVRCSNVDCAHVVDHETFEEMEVSA